MMKRRAPALGLGGIVLAVCAAQACRRHDPPPLGLDSALELTKGPVAFPPADSAWIDREALPERTSQATLRTDAPIRVTSPSLDEDRHFEFDGQTLRVTFSERVYDERDAKNAPQLSITPKVKGKTVWPSPYEVEFRADKPFDPDKEYTVDLPELVGPSKHKLEGGFHGTFKAQPNVVVAGKTVHYIPKPGHARVVAIQPGDGTTIGAGQDVTIIYDQPVDIGFAWRSVTLKNGAGKRIGASLRHPDARAYEGQKIDPRYIVVASPAPLVAPGEELNVEAAPQVKDDDSPTTRSFTIAHPPKLEEIGCAGSSDCEAKGTFVRAAHTSTVQIRWSNPVSLGYDDAKKLVRVTPTPKNLYVSGWSDLTISGSFEPSRTYSISVAGLHDQYGASIAPLSVTFETNPLPASATLSEGVLVLDEPAVRAFSVTTRNVERGVLELWPVAKSDPSAFAKALGDVRASGTPSGDPIALPFVPAARRDVLVDTAIDLGKKVERGRAYVARVKIDKEVPHAPTSGAFPSGSDAAKPPVALLYAAGPNALGAHVHQVGDKAVAQVFRVSTGEPVAGAKVAVGAASATTDALGTAILAVPPPAPAEEPILVVTADDAELMTPLGGAALTASTSLFPELGARTDDARDAVGMIVTDRGVYRPGSKMFVKALLRRVQSAGIKAAAAERVRLHVVDPMNKDVLTEVLTTNARGAVARDVAFEKNGHTGRFHVKLELDDPGHTVVADQIVRVADFEVPKFKVDVEPNGAGEANVLEARVVGRYLFGAPMGGGKVSWVLSKKPAAVKGGALAEAGLSFEKETYWWEDRRASEAAKPVTGEGVLGEDGALALHAAMGPLEQGPTEVTLEADVSDASNRHVAGTLRVVKDPFARHAGLKISRRFGEAKQPLHVELGVVDANGAPVPGVKVRARLDRLTYARVAEKAESGAIVEQWKDVAKPETSCDLTSGAAAVACDLPIAHGGTYRVVAVVDGRDDASTSFWAYGDYGYGYGEASAVPSNGKKIPLVLDKAKYKGGETAKVFVQNPWKKAIALLTIEEGGLLHHEARRVDGPSTTFDVPLGAANVPWSHAAVTLLPIGEREADYRVGVVRIPVQAADTKLDVKVAAAKKQYGPRDDAEVTIEVKRGDGAPVKNADVTLAVVDEGVLRMTAFHAIDPSLALRPGKGLDFRAFDTRGVLLRRRERAHVAGDGGEGAEESLDTRKSFVETAAWLPDLVTDDRGRATAKIKLPDNLTEFRMMAVVVDDAGAGGSAEAGFTVSKPLLLEPVMPRFALRGDAFEAAAMVHNNTDAPVAAKVTVAGQVRDVTVPARGRQRVAVPMTADVVGTHKTRFAVEVDGKARDKVEVPFRVDAPGIEEHPQVSGVFRDRQIVELSIPGDVSYDEGDAVSIKSGSALYPELGQRLSYLLDYPHGCVEQTTSSTIPLVAARTILPWTGVTGLEDAELKKRIQAGVDRLATMQTPSGGLAYWPGGGEPNVFGSAYALRLLVRAKEIGIERPKLVEGVSSFLVTRLANESQPELKVAIGEVLGRAGALPESSADSLYDTRKELGSFGLASLAIALSSLPKQDDRVKDVLDRLEASFDDDGEPKKGHDQHDWHWWGSEDRDRAQAVIALAKLRRESRLLPLLSSRLARKVERWTTQSTAWSLLALADYIGSRTPDGSVDVSMKLEGRILDTYQRLGGDNKEVRIPLKDLAGKHVTLVMTGDARVASAFAIDARYKRPLGAAGTRLAKRAAKGVSVHRAYSDPSGKPIDLAHVKAGQVVRVAVRIELPKMDSWRLSYVAITDRLPAGLDPIDPDLATTGSVPDLLPEHPFYDGLHGYGSSATHVDLRPDRVQLYFDRTWSRTLYATYLARATTRGKYTLPPTSGEMMYEPDSEGWSDAGSLTVE